MTKESETKNLVDVKRALAEKYARLAQKTKSRPKRKTLANRAERYRRQADEVARR